LIFRLPNLGKHTLFVCFRFEIHKDTPRTYI
jgi:hypothetical protein